MKNIKHKRHYISSLILLFSLMGLIFYLSAQTAVISVGTSGFFVQLFEKLFGVDFEQELIRTLAHFCEYALLAFLMSNTFLARFRKTKQPLPIVAAWGYAWTDEIHQIFVDGRAFQLSDLAVDLGGILLGAFCYFILIKIIKAFSEKRITPKTKSEP